MKTYHDKERRWMVSDQIEARGVHDERVLGAMLHVPRHEFVGPEFRDHAYRDTPISIGYGQTISQPFTVAFIVDALQLKKTDRVLDVGAGCGYQAAVLSHLAGEVHAIERHPELAESCAARLERLGYHNVTVHQGDGTRGLSQEAPFDAVAVAAGAKEIPAPLQQQLTDGGRIVIPVGARPRIQRMQRLTLRSGEFRTEDLGGFAFVPLIGEYGWDANDDV